jgi:hypothetical protein
VAGDQHSHRFGASIHCLMLLVGENFESFAGVEDEVAVVYFKREFSFEDVEELACARGGGVPRWRWEE